MFVISLECIVYVEALDPSAIDFVLVNIIGLIVSIVFIVIIFVFFLRVIISCIVSSLACSARIFFILFLINIRNAIIDLSNRFCPLNWVSSHCSN